MYEKSSKQNICSATHWLSFGEVHIINCNRRLLYSIVNPVTFTNLVMTPGPM